MSKLATVADVVRTAVTLERLRLASALLADARHGDKLTKATKAAYELAEHALCDIRMKIEG